MCVYCSNRATLLYSSVNTSGSQNYLIIDLILKNGVTIHMNNSVLRRSIEPYVNKVHNCSMMRVVTWDFYPWTMQYSYYLQITYEYQNKEYFEVLNTSSMYLISTNQSTVHYSNAYDTDFQHGIIYVENTVLALRDDQLSGQSVITIAQQENCVRDNGSFLILFSHGSETVRGSYTVDSVVVFQGPYVYFMARYRNFMIDFINLPQCEIVFRHQLLVRRQLESVRRHCRLGFFEVRIISRRLCSMGGTIFMVSSKFIRKSYI